MQKLAHKYEATILQFKTRLIACGTEPAKQTIIPCVVTRAQHMNENVHMNRRSCINKHNSMKDGDYATTSPHVNITNQVVTQGKQPATDKGRLETYYGVRPNVNTTVQVRLCYNVIGRVTKTEIWLLQLKQTLVLQTVLSCGSCEWLQIYYIL